ncbi:hypothetical protein NQ315_000246 [Exocentrus adspersus]|uniref:non-specific serine/threonine protein kinase n=1 Tax=Exocentrus adspersus TaxID=1586481 RepID=A0AAV8VSB2_9CUCU|nr:hypothetical protein NQ315_000246 [Exocentrus adspersus]
METSKEPVSVRIARLNAEIIGRAPKLHATNPLSRESLLDTLQALYEECSLENLQKYDSNIADFVEKYKSTVKELKQLRVNVTDFEIKDVIGRGRFGEVHLVKEKQTGDVYAMKTLRKFDSDTKKTSFEEERNIMAFGNSHWLTSLQYSFQDNAYLFFVMEYHPGGDLLGLLYRQGGTLPESAATFYIAELVLALEALHNMGYVHRDIKPDNILLDRCGHLKLADFGSAAKLNTDKSVNLSPPVGTPDYIAPEVLQCLDNKNVTSTGYGVSCDYWSLGVVAYELTIGSTPFAGQSSTSIYSKIMNAKNTLKFPPDVVLSQAYVAFVKALLTDQVSRLGPDQIRTHDLFKNTYFDTLRDQVPPFVPKITSVEDTGNFTDVQSKRKTPTIESFKKRTQFSGRNLPFIGFTFTHDQNGYDASFDRERKMLVKDEVVEGLKKEVECLRRKLVRSEDFDQERDATKKKLEEKSRKLEGLESLRDRLEKDLASNIAENVALKRTLELERKDRAELERKALDLIKGAKLKWELAEKTKVDALLLELEQQNEKITQLTTTNNMLNEQLQHALKLQDKHKESLETVQSLSRRSVVGLESRLEKITSETQGTITELQRKLSETVHEKVVLEGKLDRMRDKEEALRSKLKRSEGEYEDLKSKVDEAEKVIRLLNDQVTNLELDVGKIECYKEQIARLQEIIDNSHKIVKDLENRNTFLQLETKALAEYKKEVESMKKTIANLQNDRRVAQLESQLFEEREKCQALKNQLQESESVVTENQELRELRTKYWRMEKELSNCKIDKRILERELKDAQAEIKQLGGTVKGLETKLQENKKAHETALLELSGINESISMELVKVKDNYNNLQRKKKTDGEKVIIQELKDILRTKDEQINSSSSEIEAFKKDKRVLENEIQRLANEKSRLLSVMESLQKEKSEIYDELDKAKRETGNLNLNLDALREACTLLENQVIEYEKISAAFEAKHASLNANTEKLIQDLCQAKENIQEAKKQTNEEKSLRLVAENKIKRLTEDIQCLQNECTAYKNQCIEYKQCSASLSDELGVAEEKISELEVAVKSYERQLGDLKVESKIIKLEVSDYLTQLGKVKETNHKLNHQLSELRQDRAELACKLNELERVLEEKSNYYRERELKSDSTIKQQIKLIDYLQTKIDELSNKKRTLADVLFGSSKKENQPPAPILNYKDLELQLCKEREANKQLMEELCRVKASSVIRDGEPILDKANKVRRNKSEVLSPKSKAAMEQIVQSPSKQKGDLYRQHSVQRMHHNIPHRFDSKLCAKASTRCFCCSETITLGKSMHACKECGVTTHLQCASSVPNTCGLPRAFAKHYKDSLEQKTDQTSTPNPGEDEINVEGWIKVPSKSGAWEKRYACLSNTSITVYTGPQKQELVEEFALKPVNSHGKVILEPLPSEIGVPVADSDLAFILKVEVAPDTTCWPQKCFIFMTLSAQDKDKWFLALQKIYCEDFDKPKFDKVFAIPEGVSVNCVVDLTENIKLVGAAKGLYAYHDNNLLYIEALSVVHHIALVPNATTVLMIANDKSTLISCDLNHLINVAQCAQCTKPRLKYMDVNVNNLTGFHILQVSKFPKQPKACVATTKQLVILGYDIGTADLTPLRVLDTAEPVSCALFTENSLVVGVDKFFEIDLQSFHAEEFLDVSDAKLKQVVKCYKMGSFPLAVLQISKNPKEYLLCFNEFCIFVDEYGRSSRDMELKSTHLPRAFYFSKPFLYIVQFAAIEIVKISEDTCNEESGNDAIPSLDTVRLDVDKFQYVGCGKKGIYIVQGGEVKFIDARKFGDVDASSIISETTENDSDRFSFTSSIVQSLDGNLSDTDSGEVDTHRQRRVKFTDL